MSQRPIWREVFEGGSPVTEHYLFLGLADEMARLQESNRLKAGEPHPKRTLHAKTVIGIDDARLVVDATLPADVAVAYFQPSICLTAAVRFSNASGIAQSDEVADMRGAAVKIALPTGGVHDLLMTSYPVSHARNARQFVEFALIASGDRKTMPARLIEKFGEDEARRMINNVTQGMRQCDSLALQRFWSRGAILWGEMPVRFDLRPYPDAVPTALIPGDPDGLRTEFGVRLAQADIRYRLALQPYVNEQQTPIEDGSVEWPEHVSPFIEVATLTISRRTIFSSVGQAQFRAVDAMAFNPWNAPPEFRPLGNLNRARAVIYGMSALRWRETGAT
jgi:hypothetical protein